jgi:hypothetical protein
MKQGHFSPHQNNRTSKRVACAYHTCPFSDLFCSLSAEIRNRQATFGVFPIKNVDVNVITDEGQ